MSECQKLVREIITKARGDKNSKSSINQYTKSVCQIVASYGVESINEGNFHYIFVEDKDGVAEYLTSEYSNPNTLKNKISAIIPLLEGMNEDRSIIEWYEEFRSRTQERIDGNKDATLSKAELNNWVTTEEYNALTDELYAKIKPFLKMKPADIRSNKKIFNQIQSYIVLMIYKDNNLRADLVDTIFTNQDVDQNHIRVKKRAPRFTLVLKEYKTHKSNGDIQYPLTDKNLVKVLTLWEKVVPQKDAKKYLLYMTRGDKPMISGNDLTKYFVKIFEEYADKSFTINLNRKRLVSSHPEAVKLAKLMNSEELKDAAKQSGHSVKTMVRHYAKTNVPKS